MSIPAARTTLHEFWTSPTWSIRGVAAAAAVMPVIYSLLLPFALLDGCVEIYQRLTFPLLGIAQVARGDFFVSDRHRLPYLNPLQKLNCTFCGYANGVLAFVREVAARTEQFWCPIKHAQTRPDEHGRYARFADYGDVRGFRRMLPALRRELATNSRRDAKSRL